VTCLVVGVLPSLWFSKAFSRGLADVQSKSTSLLDGLSMLVDINDSELHERLTAWARLETKSTFARMIVQEARQTAWLRGYPYVRHFKVGSSRVAFERCDAFYGP